VISIMNELETEFWKETCQNIILGVEDAVKPLIGTSKAGKIVKMGADGTPSTLIDMVAEEKVTEILKTLEKSVFLISEEIGEIKIGKGPAEAILVVDPLDGTSNAVKNIPAYGISIAVADISPKTTTLQDVTMGMVKNFATGDLYYGSKGGGAFLNSKRIQSSKRQDISSSSVGAYVYRGDMNRLEPLCKAVRRMRTLGSVAIEICYVADGTYDAFVDVKKNLRIVDVSAAKIIVEESGGTITDQYCHPLSAKLSVIEKTSLVASGNREIHRNIMGILGGI